MLSKDTFIKQTANKLSLDEKLVATVVNSTFQDVLRTMSHTPVTQVEIGGLGVFTLNLNKTQKKLDELYRIKKSYQDKFDLHDSKLKVLNENELKNLNTRMRSVTTLISRIENKYLNHIKNLNESKFQSKRSLEE